MNSIKGKVSVIGNTINRNNFSVRTFVINTGGLYPQLIELQVVKDNTALLDSLRIGDNVECFYNLKGRLWTSPEGVDKYFNSIEVWKIETETSQTKQDQTNPPATSKDKPVGQDRIVNDDLPF
jgi:hypothetical protein